MKVTNSAIPSSKSSEETKRRRTQEISRIRDRLSVGDAKEQKIAEMKSLSKKERNDLMKEANFQITIPPEQGLAMKADLCLPWNKLRVMRRYKHNHYDYIDSNNNNNNLDG